MAGTEGKPIFPVDSGIDISVPGEHADRGAGGTSVIDTGDDFHFVRFPPFRGANGTGSPPLHLLLDIRFGDGESRRTAVNHHSHAVAVALTEAGEGKKFPQSVTHLS